jgi:glutamate formiminotransferase
MTPFHTVVETVRHEAEKQSVDVAGTEIIGLLPEATLDQAARFYLRLEHFDSGIVIERKLAELLAEHVFPTGSPPADFI